MKIGGMYGALVVLVIVLTEPCTSLFFPWQPSKVRLNIIVIRMVSDAERACVLVLFI
jgi:hypothetical protein